MTTSHLRLIPLRLIHRDLSAEAGRRNALTARRIDRRAAFARPLLAALDAGPDWLYRRVPLGVHAALLAPVQAQEDRDAAASYRASCERDRQARAAERLANGPGCPWCPSEKYQMIEHLPGDMYAECTECFALWFVGPKADDE